MSDATDLHVRQCNVRLVRKAEDGAHWLDRQDHIAFARRLQPLLLKMIEELLVPELEALGATPAIDSLAIRLDVPAAQLRGAAPLSRPAFRSLVRSAVQTAIVEAKHTIRSERGLQGVPPQPDRPAKKEKINPGRPEPGRIIALKSLYRDGRLSRVLSQLGPAALNAITALILTEWRPQPQSNDEGQHKAMNGLNPPVQDADTVLRESKLWIFKAVASLEERLPAGVEGEGARPESLLAKGQDLIRLLTHCINPQSAMGSPEVKPPQRDNVGLGPEQWAEQSGFTEERVSHSLCVSEASGTAPSESFAGRFHVECALPFLVMLRLSHHGVFDLATASTASRALVFAIGLKAQSSPGRDGMRSVEERMAAALVAGATAPVSGGELAWASRNGEAEFEICRAALNSSMAPTLQDAAILPAVYQDNRFMLLDRDGHYFAGGLDARSLSSLLAGRDPILALPEGDGEGLAALAAEGVTAFCGGSPARGESFAPISSPDSWQGMMTGSLERLMRWRGILPRLGKDADRARSLWHALSEDRPLCPADVKDLNLTAALLSGFGLADIGHCLFQQYPEAWADPDPLLVIERFADLPARIDCSRDEILVTLPLGRRFTDLSSAGLLAHTPDLPWLGGRVLRVSGG